jgi:hypothetical protein
MTTDDVSTAPDEPTPPEAPEPTPAPRPLSPTAQLVALIEDPFWLKGRTPLRKHAILQHLRAARMLLNGQT